MRPSLHPVLEDGTKRCSKCAESKPHTLQHFANSHGKPGSICRECKYAPARVQQVARWREKYSVASGGNQAWAELKKAYYHTEDGKRAHKNAELSYKFGITLDDYEQRLAEQGGLCAICDSAKPGGKGVFHVDHDHKTGRIRGLLCHLCNVGLGNLRDSRDLLLKAVAYLDEHSDIQIEMPVGEQHYEKQQ